MDGSITAESRSADGTSPQGDAAGAVLDEPRRELVDATQYDLGRLEHVIARLITQHAALARENESLSTRLRARDGDVERLERELRSAVERRQHALQRVDALIEELDQLDVRLDEAMLVWKSAEDADSEPQEASDAPEDRL